MIITYVICSFHTHHNYRKEDGVIAYLISDQNGLYGVNGSSILQFPTVVDLVDFCCCHSILGPLKEGVAKKTVCEYIPG